MTIHIYPMLSSFRHSIAVIKVGKVCRLVLVRKRWWFWIWWNDTDRENPKYFDKNLFHCQFFPPHISMDCHRVEYTASVFRVDSQTTVMHRLTTEISSGKCVFRLFHRCANVYLQKPTQYSTVQPTAHLGYMV